MKKQIHLLSLTAAALSLFLLSGCMRKEVSTKVAIGVPHGQKTYKPIKNPTLSLKMLGKPIRYAGEKAIFTFSLSNTGNRAVEIPEWFSYEPDNLVLYVQPRTTDMSAPIEEYWIKLDFDPRKPVFHYPLTLMPSNQVLISKELPVIEKLQLPPHTERRFFIKAELALTSVKLSSEVVELRVLPNPVVSDKNN